MQIICRYNPEKILAHQIAAFSAVARLLIVQMMYEKGDAIIYTTTEWIVQPHEPSTYASSIGIEIRIAGTAFWKERLDKKRLLKIKEALLSLETFPVSMAKGEPLLRVEFFDPDNLHV